jgi:hypothetical protein
MPVNQTHREYDAVVPKWSLVRSIVNNDARKYIRIVDKNDMVRSDQYRSDAILTNFTRLTKVGLTGLIFTKPSTVELAPELEYLEEDATGSGFGLEQFAQQIIGEVLITGRYGILVDYPEKLDPLNEPDDNYARLRPYTAENMINWKTEDFGSETKLTLMVLKESVCVEGVDMFDHSYEDQYRVLMLSQDQVYQQAIYNKDCELVSINTPVDYNGKPFEEIPFEFIGSENNDACIDSLPLYDLAVVNLGHYRNSADLEESIFITGQPFLVVNIGETDDVSFKQANPNGLNFGSRSGLIVANGGEANLLQANANQMVSVEMKRKEEQAASIGARLISPSGGRETAEAARIRYGAQNSALYVLTRNVSAAIEECLDTIAEFMMEVPTESTFELNNQFYEDTVDPQLLAQQIMLLDRNAISVEEIRDSLKLSGVLPAESDSSPDVNNVINPLTNVDPNVTAE